MELVRKIKLILSFLKVLYKWNAWLIYCRQNTPTIDFMDVKICESNA